MQKTKWLIGILTILFLGSAPLGASNIDPLLWEQLVLDADMVGVVECRTAGGVVARYEIVESWKGPEEGTVIQLRIPTNYFEPQFPTALCGKRYLLTAKKSEPAAEPDRAASTAQGAVPLWWRQQDFDYELPLFQGRVELPLDKDVPNPLSGVGSGLKELGAFRRAVEGFLELEPAEQEIWLLRRLARKYIRFGHYVEGEWVGNEDAEEEFDTRLQSCEKPKDVLILLIDLARRDPVMMNGKLRKILVQGGAKPTLEMVSKVPRQELPEIIRNELDVVEEALIARQTEAPEEENGPDDQEERKPTERDLKDWRIILKVTDDPWQFNTAIKVLTQYDPKPVADFLKKWRNPDESWRDADRGYVLGSYFGWRCGSDRVTHLTDLAKNAEEPYIRVAAAVYLAYDDEAKAVPLLRKMLELDGEPGAWAALTLARRGYKDAVERGMLLFAYGGKDGMAGVPHRNLQKRMLVLLSNSARQSDVPQPPTTLRAPWDVSQADREIFWERTVQHYLSWWKKHQESIELADPWLPVLAEQQID